MGSSLARSVKDVAKLTSASLSVRLVGLAALGYFTRHLTKEELTVLPVYEMLAAMATVIFTFGVQPTILRTLPNLLENDRPAARGFIRVSGSIFIAGGALFGIGTYLAAPRLAVVLLHDPAHASLLRVMAVGFSLSTLRIFFNYLLWSSSRFDGLSLLRVSYALGRALLGVGGLMVGGLRGLVVGLVLNEVSAMLVGLAFTRDLLRGESVRRHGARRLLKESFPYYLESYLMYFRAQGDNWIVATTLGPAAMSIYFVAKRIPQVLLMVTDSLDKIITADLARKRDDHDAIRDYVHRISVILANTAVPGIMVIIGLIPAVITVLAGPSYRGAVLPASLLSLMQMVFIMQIPFGRAIFIVRRPIVRVLQTSLESVVLIGSLWFLAPWLRENGVALSRLLAAVASWCYAYVLLRRSLRTGAPWQRYLRALLPAAAMAVAVQFLLAYDPRIVMAPLFAAAGGVLFLLISSMVNSRGFYGSLDEVLPFTVRDPLRVLLGKRKRG